MANIPLQSITFPGLSDKYTTPVVDNTLTQTGAAADAKKTGDEIGAIKNDLLDGTFIVNNAENAEQLTSTVGIEDTTPYLYRTSGGSVDIGDREDVKKIVGGTIVNNQLLSNGNFASASGWRIYDNTKGSLSVSDETATLSYTTAGNGGYAYGLYLTQSPLTSETGHKFFASSQVKIDFSGKVKYEIGTGITNPEMLIEQNKWVEASVVCNKENSGTTVMLKPLDADIVSGSTMQVKSFMITDLTQAFGTTIADYVYNLETATAGAGVAWLKKHFPAQFDAGYQAYDAGSLQSVSGLTAHKMVGFNQFDKDTMAINGVFINDDNGKTLPMNNSKATDYIRVIPNTAYYIKSDQTVAGWGAWYDADKNYISKIVGYTVNGAQKLHTAPTNAQYMRLTCVYANNGNIDTFCINLHWDGEKDGQYEPYKEYTYALDSSLTLRGIPKVDASGNLYYDGDEYLPDGTVNRYWAERAYQSGDESDGSTMITDGTKTVYKLDTPTTETASPYQETQIVDDFGTEEFVLADGAFPVPVGHNTMYQNNLRAKLEMSPDSPDGDGLYVVQQESGENTYVPLASTATIQDILARLTALENA